MLFQNRRRATRTLLGRTDTSRQILSVINGYKEFYWNWLIVKNVPLPTSLDTDILHPWRSIIDFTMDSPNPVPAVL